MHPRQAEAAFKEYIQRAGESDERAGIDAQMEVRSARAHRDGEQLREPLLKHYEEEDVDEHTDLKEVTDNIKNYQMARLKKPEFSQLTTAVKLRPSSRGIMK